MRNLELNNREYPLRDDISRRESSDDSSRFFGGIQPAIERVFYRVQASIPEHALLSSDFQHCSIPMISLLSRFIPFRYVNEDKRFDWQLIYQNEIRFEKFR